MPKKLSLSSTSSSRKALALFGLLLFSNHSFSLKQLPEQLECSRQTILRLLEEIELTNTIRIKKWKEGMENYYQVEQPAKQAHLSFTEEELTQLLLCRDFTAHILPENQRALLNLATGKAGQFIEKKENIPSHTLGQGAAKGIVDCVNGDEVLDLLLTAKQTMQVLEIEYLARLRAEPKLHAFVPARIVAYHDGLYVRGWKVTDKGTVNVSSLMTLALQRIQKIWPTRRTLPAKLAAAYPIPLENKVFGVAHDKAPFEVGVTFYPPASVFVKERIWSYNQRIEEHEDSSITLHFTSCSEMEVVKWVLGFGREARLLYPAHLSESVHKELQDSLKNY